MAKLLRVTKTPRTGKAVVPIASSAGLASELKALTDRLSDDPGVKKFTVTVNKETGIAKATAVARPMPRNRPAPVTIATLVGDGFMDASGFGHATVP